MSQKKYFAIPEVFIAEVLKRYSSRSAFAKAANLDRSVISHLQDGQPIGPARAKKIQKALQVPLSNVFSAHPLPQGYRRRAEHPAGQRGKPRREILANSVLRRAWPRCKTLYASTVWTRCSKPATRKRADSRPMKIQATV